MSIDYCNFCGRTIDPDTAPRHPVKGLGGGVFTPICIACVREGDVSAETYRRIMGKGQ